ncbi:MAG: DUF4286 family protein [Phycisphaerales bacterium]|jgi:hypothetical protein
MSRLSYVVTATLPDESLALEYQQWLLGGHIQQVVAGGATHAEVVRILEPAAPLRVQARYGFPSRAALDRYIKEFAPALRAEGLAKFGDRVSFVREVGELLGA